jgi:hypothetical protein
VIDDTHRARAYLSRVAEPQCPELSALVAQVGPMEAARRIRSGIVDDRLARHTDARRHLDCAAADLALLARMGGRLITADDEEWPGLSFAAFGGVDTKARPQAHAPRRARRTMSGSKTQMSSAPAREGHHLLISQVVEGCHDLVVVRVNGLVCHRASFPSVRTGCSPLSWTSRLSARRMSL